MKKIFKKFRFLSIVFITFSIGALGFLLTNNFHYNFISKVYAAAPTITGNVPADFGSLTGVIKLGDFAGDVGFIPGDVSGTPGWDVRNVYMWYDKVADKMYLGVECAGICGDADGNGNPGTTGAPLTGAGGADGDWDNFEWSGMFLDLNNSATSGNGGWDIAVGNGTGGGTTGLGTGWKIYTGNPADTTPNGNVNGLTLYAGTATTSVLSNNSGATANDIEFVINDYSTLPGYTAGNFPHVFYGNGSIRDAGVGEDYFESQPVKISGHVKEDTNSDGVGDVCISVVTLTLVDATGNPVLVSTVNGSTAITTTTGATGPAFDPCYYEFPYLPSNTIFNLASIPSEYGIQETQPVGYVSVNETAGTGADGFGISHNGSAIVHNQILHLVLNDGNVSVNNDFVEEKPTITVNKTVVNNNGGTALANAFQMTLNNVNVTQGVANPAVVGNNTVAETAVAGYSQSSIVCTVNATGATVANPIVITDTSVDDDFTCLVTNDDIPPTLKVTKVVVNDNGGTKVISDFPLFINATSVTSGTANNLNAGVAYTVSETAQTGYAQTSIVCTDNANGAAVSNPVTLALDQDVSCVITNDDIAPTLTVTKVVVNDNGGTKVVANFPLLVNATSVTSGTANTESAGVAYTVSETAQAGYTQTSLVCKDNATAATVANPVTLALDQDVTCTITNDDVAPTLKVVKVVVNDNGGTKVVSDFALTINATAVTSGTANTELANTALTVAETTLAGYTQTSLVCKDNATGGTVTNPVTLAPAQNVTCTITNDDIQPLLTVTKIVTNNNGGTKVVTDFPLKVGATTVTSGTQAGFNAATYTVSETSSTDYQSTITGDCNAAGSITLSVGDVKACTITNNDYPNLGDYVWTDANADGIQDATETGINGVTVNLYCSGNATVLSTTTTVNNPVGGKPGYYQFQHLNPATCNYIVEFVKPSGTVITTKDNPVSDLTDSDADPTTGKTIPITMVMDQDQEFWDAGIYSQKIGDYVWKDSNADGKQDSTEKGINGILVTLTDCNGLELSTTTTATNPTTLVDGYYEFYIDPGTYCVKITKPTDLVRTKQDQGTDDTVDSDIDKNYTTKPIILKPAINQPQWDAGLVEPACIGDRIYEDLNANGLEDAGEPGIPNAVVTLLLPDGTKQDKTADATGTYYFCDLTPDTYTVSIDLTQPALVNYPDFGFGYEKTSPQTVTKTLNPLDFYKLADFGYLPYAKLGDRVFIDHDKNCVFDGSDTGVSGVKLNLYDSAGNLLKSTTTDSTGTYSFTVAANLVYRVEVDPSWKTNSAILGDSDTCGLTKTSPIMKPNQNYIDLDFGFVPPPVANTGADYSLFIIGECIILIGIIVKKKFEYVN